MCSSMVKLVERRGTDDPEIKGSSKTLLFMMHEAGYSPELLAVSPGKTVRCRGVDRVPEPYLSQPKGYRSWNVDSETMLLVTF